MMVRVPFRESLLVGLVAALAGAVGGCADSSSKTDLPNKPDIYQVMVRVDPNATDTLTDPNSTFALTYGIQTDYDQCYLFDASGAGSSQCSIDENNLNCTSLCTNPAFAGECRCGTTSGGLDMVCAGASAGDYGGHCVDPDTMKVPFAANTVLLGQTIRVVVGILLDGATLEHFACACQLNGTHTDGTPLTLADLPNEGGCAGGTAWSDDPFNCSVCSGDDNSKGHCVDIDSNNLPDWSSLKPGLATITCGSAVSSGSPAVASCPAADDQPGWASPSPGTCVYTTHEGEGYFYPSGNQFLSSVTGIAGMGPAVVINPFGSLPANTDCTMSIAKTIHDKAGGSINDPASPYLWHTEAIALSAASPADGDTIDITANAQFKQLVIDANTVLGGNFDITITDLNATTPTTVTTSVDLGGGGTEITATPTSALTLTDQHTYEVKVKGTLTDDFGQTLGDDFTYTFDASKKASSKP